MFKSMRSSAKKQQKLVDMSKIKRFSTMCTALKYWSNSNIGDEAPSASCVCMRTMQRISIAQMKDS